VNGRDLRRAWRAEAHSALRALPGVVIECCRSLSGEGKPSGVHPADASDRDRSPLFGQVGEGVGEARSRSVPAGEPGKPEPLRGALAWRR